MGRGWGWAAISQIINHHLITLVISARQIYGLSLLTSQTHPSAALYAACISALADLWIPYLFYMPCRCIFLVWRPFAICVVLVLNIADCIPIYLYC